MVFVCAGFDIYFNAGFQTVSCPSSFLDEGTIFSQIDIVLLIN